MLSRVQILPKEVRIKLWIECFWRLLILDEVFPDFLGGSHLETIRVKLRKEYGEWEANQL